MNTFRPHQGATMELRGDGAVGFQRQHKELTRQRKEIDGMVQAAREGKHVQLAGSEAATYSAARGLPLVGPPDHVARAIAGAGAVDRSEQSRIRRLRNKSGTELPSVNDILNQYGNTCYLCGSRVTMLTMQLEHIIPLARGGTDELTNLAPACGPCNATKATRYVAFMVATRKPIYIDATT